MSPTFDDAAETPIGTRAADGSRDATLALLRRLDATGYRFTTVTPASHARVLARADRRRARDVRDALGWSLPFAPEAVGAELFGLMIAAGVAAPAEDGLFRATVRASSVQGALFLHSAYPPDGRDAVFLGPDSHRFAELIGAEMGRPRSGGRILDYGAGAGVGGITAARAAPGATLTLADVNPAALRLAGINAECAGLDHREVVASSPADLDGRFDLIVTHPPFMIDEGGRLYRDGGALFGAGVALDWVLAGVELLAPGGRLVLHTGVSIVDGEDPLLRELHARLDTDRFAWGYRELDPDIFGEELATPAYARVDRIAATALLVVRTA
ncbi:methyltransferase [uncultured Sphingomonas sp.]|uniref:methyltransferase n=1 Tax=uncultured Sphingomonas sp. TaxID=158754 RepID=UPI0035CB2A85